MKKIYILISLLLLTLTFLFPQKKIYKYKVEVENKTVYARVFNNGKLVDNLTKDDFILYENGKRVEINGVDIIRKTFGEEEVNWEAKKHEKYKPRFFILTFKIIDYGDYLDKGIDYLFDNIIRKDDKLMFLSEHNYFVEDNIKDKEKIKKKIKKILRRESILARMKLNRIISQLKTLTSTISDISLSLRNTAFSTGTQSAMEMDKLERTIQRFLSFLREYRNRYLTPEIDRFYYFSEYIKGVKLKKWVINFYQFEKIPIPTAIRDFLEKFIGGNAENRYSWATVEVKSVEIKQELEKELNQPGDFPADEVSRLFYKGDTTFYTILLNKPRETGDNNFYYKDIYSDLEKTLKEISTSTGGEVILSNNIVEAVNKFKKKKDIIYLINYTPSVNNPRIKIKMKNPKYKVKYDPDQFSDFIERYLEKKRRENPEIIIDTFKFLNNSLRFSITDFKMEKDGKEKTGKLLVSLKITDENGKLAYNAQKTMKTKNNSVKINIGLGNILKKGIYYLYLDVYDLLTKKMASRFEIIEIK